MTGKSRRRATSAGGGWRRHPTDVDARLPGPRAPPLALAFCSSCWILLALNGGPLLLFRPGGPPRVTVPFSPYFLHAVRSDEVASISSKGDTIEGTLRSVIRYPASSATAIPTRLFITGVPTFVNDNQLAQLLETRRLQINATSVTQSTPLGLSLLLGFGPRLLIVGLLVLVVRRAGSGGARWVSSAARSPGGSIPRRSGSCSTT